MINNILIVGTGEIGKHIISAITTKISTLDTPVHYNIFVFNRTIDKAKLIVTDILSKSASHRCNFTLKVIEESALDYVLKTIDLIMYTAGVSVASDKKRNIFIDGQINRNTNVKKNISFSEIFCKKLRASGRTPYIFISTNPSATMIRLFCESTGIPSTKILGCGLELDEARMNFFLEESLKPLFPGKSIVVETTCVGFHAEDAMLFPEKLILVNQKPIDDLTGIDVQKRSEIVEACISATRQEGIKHASIVGGSAAVTHAQTVSDMFITLISSDQQKRFSVTVLLKDFPEEMRRLYSNNQNYCLGVPITLSPHGAQLSLEFANIFANTKSQLKEDVSLTILHDLQQLSEAELRFSTKILRDYKNIEKIREDVKRYHPSYADHDEPQAIKNAVALYDRGQMPEAKKAFMLLKQDCKDVKQRLRIYLSIAIILTTLQEYFGPESALEHYRVALKFWIDVHDKEKISEGCILLQNVISDLDRLFLEETTVFSQRKRKYPSMDAEHEEVVVNEHAYFQKIAAWSSKIKNDTNDDCYKLNKKLLPQYAYAKVRIFNNLGILCFKLNLLTQAYQLFEQVKKMAQDPFYTNVATQNIALVLSKQNKYCEALKELDETRLNMQDPNDALLTASTQNAYGMVHYNTQHYTEAKISFSISLNLLLCYYKQHDIPHGIEMAYAMLNIAKTLAKQVSESSDKKQTVYEEICLYVHTAWGIFNENKTTLPPEDVLSEIDIAEESNRGLPSNSPF